LIQFSNQAKKNPAPFGSGVFFRLVFVNRALDVPATCERNNKYEYKYERLTKRHIKSALRCSGWVDLALADVHEAEQ
jgi:hypothetical protein